MWIVRNDKVNQTKTHELSPQIRTDVARVLDSYDCELPSWEHAEFILNNQQWGNMITLTRDEADDEITGKALQIEGPSQISIVTY